MLTIQAAERVSHMNLTNGLQLVAKVLGHFIFLLPRCIGVYTAVYNVEFYPSNLADRFQLCLGWGGGGGCKIKQELLKSKDFVMEHYFIQRPKYFCHRL